MKRKFFSATIFFLIAVYSVLLISCDYFETKKTVVFKNETKYNLSFKTTGSPASFTLYPKKIATIFTPSEQSVTFDENIIGYTYEMAAGGYKNSGIYEEIDEFTITIMED